MKHETLNYDSIEGDKEKRRFSMSNTSFLWQRYDEVKRGGSFLTSDKKSEQKNGSKKMAR